MGSISHHITPLVINSLGGGHTHTRTHMHTYRHSRTAAILRTSYFAYVGSFTDHAIHDHDESCFRSYRECSTQMLRDIIKYSLNECVSNYKLNAILLPQCVIK